MNRIERDKQRSRMKKQIDDIIRNNPEYARRHKEEQEENVMQPSSSTSGGFSAGTHDIFL